MKALEHLSWRYATKKFDSTKKVSEAQLNALLEAIRLAPTSFGLQGFKVLVVEDLSVREKLKAASWGQGQITEASQLLVFTVPTNFGDQHIDRFLDSVVSVRGVERSSLDQYEQMMKGGQAALTEEQRVTWLAKQTYIALGFVLSAAAALRIDTCPMEGFDKAQYDEILGLKAKNLTSTVVCPIGFRAEDDKYQSLTKVRKCNEELFEKI